VAEECDDLSEVSFFMSADTNLINKMPLTLMLQLQEFCPEVKSVRPEWVWQCMDGKRLQPL
jgi:hypothetical protein